MTGRDILNDCIDKLTDLMNDNPILKESLYDIIKDLEESETEFMTLENDKDELQDNYDNLQELYDDMRYIMNGGRF